MYCNDVFQGGASLIHHHLCDECPDPRGGERSLREGRALASLGYDKLWYELTHKEKPKKPTFEDLTDTASSVGGGVPITEDGDLINLYDECSDAVTVDGNEQSQPSTEKDIAGNETESQSDNIQTWAKTLFPEAKPTPVTDGFKIKEETQTPFSRRTDKDLRMAIGMGPQMKSDWDYAEFTHNDGGQFECPYVSCK